MSTGRTKGRVEDVFHGVGITVLFLVGSAVQIVLGGHGGGTAGIFVARCVVGLVTGGADVGGQGIAAMSACSFFALFASLSILIFPRDVRVVPVALFAIAACLAWAIPLFVFSDYWPITAITGSPILASAGLAVRRVMPRSRAAKSRPTE